MAFYTQDFDYRSYWEYAYAVRFNEELLHPTILDMSLPYQAYTIQAELLNRRGYKPMGYIFSMTQTDVLEEFLNVAEELITATAIYRKRAVFYHGDCDCLACEMNRAGAEAQEVTQEQIEDIPFWLVLTP